LFFGGLPMDSGGVVLSMLYGSFPRIERWGREHEVQSLSLYVNWFG
jgi:hypothetical protein